MQLDSTGNPRKVVSVLLHTNIHTHGRRERKQKVAAERESLQRVLSAREMASARPNLFIWTISRPSRKERKEADARAINKTSPPQIFAVHAKKQAAHTQGAAPARPRCFICLVSHSTAGKLLTKYQIIKSTTLDGLITVACAARALWGTNRRVQSATKTMLLACVAHRVKPNRFWFHDLGI